MKKLKFLLLLTMLVPVSMSAVPNIVSEQVSAYNDDWESLGSITAYQFVPIDGGKAYSLQGVSGTLYVKTKGSLTFYRFRYYDKDYVVSRSNEKKNFNACITISDVKYYLNIP